MNELGRMQLRRGRLARAARHFTGAARSAPEASVYGRNVNIAVQRAVARAISVVFAVGCVITFVGPFLAPRLDSVIFLTELNAVALGIAALSAMFRKRMPPEARPLFRRRRIIAALSVSFGFILSQCCSYSGPTKRVESRPTK